MLVHLEPVSKPRQTRADQWRKRPCVMRYRAFADKLRLLVGPIPRPPLELSLVFYLPIPKSRRAGKHRLFHDSPHLGKPDIDNLVKAVLDALWEQDSGVWRVTAEKRWTLGEPRISIDFGSPQATGCDSSINGTQERHCEAQRHKAT